MSSRKKAVPVAPAAPAPAGLPPAEELELLRRLDLNLGEAEQLEAEWAEKKKAHTKRLDELDLARKKLRSDLHDARGEYGPLFKEDLTTPESPEKKS